MKRKFKIIIYIIGIFIFNISFTNAVIYKDNNELSFINKDFNIDKNKELTYIVEFYEKPIFTKQNENLLEITYKFLWGKDVLINNEQKDFINKYKRNNGNLNVKNKWKNLFNGILIESNLSINELKSLPNVKNVFLDEKVNVLLQQSVPLISADKVWSLQNLSGSNITGTGVKVAILDTGIDYTNSNFGSCTQEQILSFTCPKIAYSLNYISGSNDVYDDNSHGTHCAGIISANGELRGVAPNSTLLIYKVLDSSGSGTSSNVISAIENATLYGVDVISLSLGGNGFADTFGDVIKNSVENGVVVVVASGNSGSLVYGTINSPGSDIYALTVGATDKTDNLAYYSSKGFSFYSNNSIASLKPDVLAPGSNINSTIPGGYSSYSGTSMATPHVAGAVALIKQMHPTWTPNMIKSAVSNRADNLNYEPNFQGGGRLNILNSINTTTFINPNSISFDLPINSSPFNMSINLTIMNTHNENMHYNIINNFSNNGLDLYYNNTLYIISNQSKNITITLMVNESLMVQGIYNGNLILNSTDGTERIPIAIGFFYTRNPNFYNYTDNNGTLNNNGIGTFSVYVNNSKYMLFCIDHSCDIPSNPSENHYTYEHVFYNPGIHNYFWLAFWNYSANGFYASNVRKYIVNDIEEDYYNEICYQESANTTNQSGTDGVCGLNYSGSYGYNDGWIYNKGLMHDGNWESYNMPYISYNLGIFYVNYTIPLNTSSAYYQVKIEENISNFSVPSFSSCWNVNGKLMFKISSIRDYSGYPLNTTIDCYNGTNWEYVGISTNVRLYEEGIYWNINTSYIPNCTASCTGKCGGSSDGCGGTCDEECNYCYQESSNTTNQNGTDGNCNLNYTGSYYYDSNWWNALGTGGDKVIDGNWETYGSVYGPGGLDSYIYINYTKPSGIINALLRTGDESPLIEDTNVTITQDCLNYYNDKLSLRGKIIWSDAHALWSCYDGEWNDIRETSSDSFMWEEGIYWAMGEDEEPSENGDSKILIINKADSLVYTYLNNSRSNITIYNGTSIYLNASRQSGEGSIKLYNNVTLINTGIIISNLTTFNTVGLFNITSIYEETQNYTSSYETWLVNVTTTQDTTNPDITIISPTPFQLFTTPSITFNISSNKDMFGCYIQFDSEGSFNFEKQTYLMNMVNNRYFDYTNNSNSDGIHSAYFWCMDTSENVNDTEHITYAVDYTKPYFTGIGNITMYDNQSLSYDINATDDIDFGYFKINWTNTFSINKDSGVLTNITGLDLKRYYINVSINDTFNNENSQVIYVEVLNSTIPYIPPANVSTISASRCRYKRYGYYNLKLPWMKQENCI